VPKHEKAGVLVEEMLSLCVVDFRYVGFQFTSVHDAFFPRQIGMQGFLASILVVCAGEVMILDTPPNKKGASLPQAAQHKYHNIFNIHLSILSFHNFLRGFLWNIPSCKIRKTAL